MHDKRWRTFGSAYPSTPIEQQFAADVAALVLIDMQKYYAEPEGPFGTALMKEYPQSAEYLFTRLHGVVTPTLARLIDVFRRRRRPVVHVTIAAVGGSPDDPIESGLSPQVLRRGGPRPHLRPGQPWSEIVTELNPVPGEAIVVKTGRSAFTSTGIDQILRNLGVEHVAIGGFATNGCVELTARDAADRGYETFLVEDGCAGFDDRSHLTTMANFELMDGTILEADALVANLRGDQDLLNRPPEAGKG